MQLMKDLIDRLRKFKKDRDWDKFHTPRNLAISIVLESTEVLEKFQWKLDETVTDKDREELKEELSDVLIYTLNLSDRLGIDLIKEANKKIDKNALKYPIPQKEKKK
jgi:NTP pyrophosphatase (non-canonical NTP hydrolase)